MMKYQADDWYGSPGSNGQNTNDLPSQQRQPPPVLIDLGACPTKIEAGLVHIILPPIKNKLESETIRFHLPPYLQPHVPHPQ
jgi:hypothetical protein